MRLTARSRLVTSLDLIVCELDECIVLFGQLCGKHGVVLFAQKFLALLQHALAYQLDLETARDKQ